MPATAERRLEDGVLWVGGSSGLALTYFEEIGVQRNERFVCTGIEPEAPVALQQLSAGYRDEGAHPDGGSWGRELAYERLDLTSEASIDLLFGGQPGQKSRLPHGLGTLVLSMRAPLWGDVSGHTLLLRHLGTLLRRAADCGIRRVVHISSVAAADHLRAQRGADEATPLPPSEPAPEDESPQVELRSKSFSASFV